MPDLFERFRRLDEIRVPDLRSQIEDRERRGPIELPSPPVRRRVIAGAVAFAVFVAAGVLAWRAFAPAGSKHVSAAATYRDPIGWSIRVPNGWHSAPFEISDGLIRYEGVQLSNVELPTPQAELGTPPQPSGSDLPKGGIAVIVARTSEPPASDEIPLPLALDGFTQGSSPAGGPVLDTAYFAAGGWTFVGTVKTGPSAIGNATERVVGRTVASFRFAIPPAAACSSSQLSGSIASTEGAAGTQFVTIALLNTSTEPCTLVGSPSVELLDPSGSPLSLKEQDGLPAGPSLRPSTMALRSGESAAVVIATHDVNMGANPCVEASSASIKPTGGGAALEVSLPSATPVCDGSVFVAPFAMLGS